MNITASNLSFKNNSAQVKSGTLTAWNLSSFASKNWMDQVKEAERVIPRPAVKLLRDRGETLQAIRNITDVRPDLKGLSAPGHQDTYENTVAAADPNGCIYFCEEPHLKHEQRLKDLQTKLELGHINPEYVDFFGRHVESEKPINVATHELGHRLNRIIGEKVGLRRISDSEEFTEVVHRDLARIPEDEKKEIFDPQYSGLIGSIAYYAQLDANGKTTPGGRDELFAQLSNIHINPDKSQDVKENDQLLVEKFPETCQYSKKLLKLTGII